MINFGHFIYGAAPRTGVVWFVKACEASGLAMIDDDPPKNAGMATVTMIRHPYTWLVSYYLAYRGASDVSPSVDQFAKYARMAADSKRFIELVLKHQPDAVSQMFDSYKADIVMRLEDMPWALVQLLDSLEDPRIDSAGAQYTLPINVMPRVHPRDRKQAAAVVAANADFCERYEYT